MKASAMKSYLAGLLGLATSVLADGRTDNPGGCACVGQGGGYEFSTIQAAIDSLSVTDEGSQCIFVYPGTYEEQIEVSVRVAQLTIYGYTADIYDYEVNEVIITGCFSTATGLEEEATAIVAVHAENFKMYNIIVRNTAGSGGVGTAVSACASSGYYACSFEGYEGVLRVEQGVQIYSKSRVVGAINIVWGYQGRGWFEELDIQVLAVVEVDTMGFITFQGRDCEQNQGYFVFNKASITAYAGAEVAEGSYYLGIAWGLWASVVFQYTYESCVIAQCGWNTLTADMDTTNIFFAEIGDYGEGADISARVEWESGIYIGIGIDIVLGADYASCGWYDVNYC